MHAYVQQSILTVSLHLQYLIRFPVSFCPVKIDESYVDLYNNHPGEFTYRRRCLKEFHSSHLLFAEHNCQLRRN